jgi:hypothetical protein
MIGQILWKFCLFIGHKIIDRKNFANPKVETRQEVLIYSDNRNRAIHYRLWVPVIMQDLLEVFELKNLKIYGNKCNQ